MTGDPDFDLFWKTYPKRVGKGAAQRSWEKVTKRMKIAPSVIIAGAKAYADEKRGTDITYVAHPSTWLNQQRWLDEPGRKEEPEVDHRGRPHIKEILDKNEICRDIRDRLIEATREDKWPKIKEAARRLEAEASELWSCLEHGGDGIRYRAWDAAVAEVFKDAPPVRVLQISREHWLSARDRLISRRSAVGAMRKMHIDTSDIEDKLAPGQQKEEIDDLQPTD
jgi:hypothetical protein